MSNQNEFEEVKNHVSLEAYADDHLQRREKLTYNCPFCGSGTHSNGTAAFKVQPSTEHWACFSCGRTGDVFDLAAKVEGISETDKKAQLEAVANWAGLSLKGGSKPTATPRTAKKQPQKPSEPVMSAQNHESLSNYLNMARKALESPTAAQAVEYLRSRGISLERAKASGIGYDPDTNSLVLPWKDSDTYYITRALTEQKDRRYRKPKSEIAGKQPLYNHTSLQGNGAVFIVEGVFDALAIEQAGGQAIALGNASGTEQLIRKAMETHFSGILVDMLDMDQAGRDGGSKMAREAAEAEIGFLQPSSYQEYMKANGYKDPGDALRSDPEGLVSLVEGIEQQAADIIRKNEEAAYKEAMNSLKLRDPGDVLGEIYSLAKAHDPIPTGLKQFDEALDGGLRPGLHIFGALSSMGKTTFILQLADQLAASGHEVLFVTIEQSAQELVAKSLSRIMYLQGTNMDATSIVTKNRRSSWDSRTSSAFEKAASHYWHTVAPHLTILEGIMQPSVQDVKAAAEEIAKHKKQTPIVFIDYLQLLKSANERDTEKQATDKNIMFLRQMARDLEAPIFVISSLNRSSYSGVITMESFKESGSIEYGADVLLGLQPYDMKDKLRQAQDRDKKESVKNLAADIIDQTKDEYTRHLEIVVLKYRNGKKPSRPIPVDMIQKYNIAK